MKKIFLLLIVLLPSCGFAQPATDYKKLSNACELWGLIKYFHPSKPGNKFDSAFAAHVPAMLKAQSEAEWKTILDEWLKSLDDGTTRIVGKDADVSDGVMKSEFIEDSVLLVTISGTKIFNDWEGSLELSRQIIEQTSIAKGVIFDLRQPGLMTRYQGYLAEVFGSAGLAKHFGTASSPQTRNLYYAGFTPERGGTSGGYSTNYILKDFTMTGNYSTSDPKVAWIVNDFSELPATALAQQDAGIGFIVSTNEHVEDLLSLTNTFKFSDKITVKYKTDEVVGASSLKADYVYASNENPIEKARAIVLGKSEPKKKNATTLKTPPSEPAVYPPGKFPDIGYRVLAAAKIYTVIHNFFPYQQYMDKNWRTVLDESLPAFIKAQNEVEYGYAVAKMYVNINDSHGFQNGNIAITELRGQAPSPLYADFIEGKVIVSGMRNDSVCKASGISIGDVILKVNGVPTEKLMEKYAQYYCHSTPQAVAKHTVAFCVRGKQDAEGVFTLQDGKGKVRDVKITFTEDHNNFAKDVFKHKDIELVNPSVGYADLSRLRPDQVDSMFEQFKNTKAIIFDMRGYPKGTAWAIAPRLTEKENVALAIFRRPEVLAPNVVRGEMLSYKSYTEFVQTVPPSNQWKYKGKTVMLINPDAMSQAEHTGLFFEAMNNTTFIGSPTVGANGDVTNFQIPGTIYLYFSGQGVWHADGRQLQRLGLQPHVLVKPTIKGFREGKDEVFDKAVEWIGKNVK
jgi:C-terminal processing protease CtpA/Prc